MKLISLFKVLLLSAMLVSFPLHADGKVNINKASASELSQMLVGIGDKKARDIITYRNKNGPFKSSDDLVLVKGIGAATVEKNRKVITVGDKKAQ